MSSSTKTVAGLNVSLVLDRRSFLVSAGMAAGVVAIAARASWSIAAPLDPECTAAADHACDATMEWAADHIFGTYPPYAHPIPFGRQYAPPVPLDEGSFDPVLMI
ncbi:MAG TPA: hypothetical protein VI653_19675 [Steroidobacteraceae bacterium]